MSKKAFSKGKLKGDQPKTVIEAVQAQIQQAAITPLLSNFLEAELETKLGRAKRAARILAPQPRSIDWQCGYCGCDDANQFTRDGHYQRNLETAWGHLSGLKVPMLECQLCQHDVVAHWAILEKFKHFWLDLDHKVLFGAGLCQSLRQLSQEWSSLIGGSVGLRTLNERINAIELLIEATHKQPISDVPSVIQFDGIWLSLQTQTNSPETIKLDKRGRKRHLRTGKRMVVLVALGLWSDGSGRKQILDWHLAQSESQAE